MKRFCFLLFNGLLLCGLAFFSFYFFIKGDTFHGWLDLLYMVIVASNILLRRQHHVMEEQVRELRKENAELTKKNAELMEHLRQINDPFSYNKAIMIAHNVRMERIVTDYKYKNSFLQGYDEMETNRRKGVLEQKARGKLLEAIIDTELIQTRFEDLDNEESICFVSLFVGVVGDKPIEEILNKESRQNRDIQ
jgi:hypothetical protein